MVYYTLKQAAAATGKHKSTILRAVQADKVPSVKDAHGGYRIDAEGLHAVYPKVVRNDAEPLRTNSATDAPLRTEKESLRTVALPDDAPLRTNAELEVDQAVSEQKSEQIDDLRAAVADLQRRLDQAENDRRQLEADRRQADDNSTRQIDQLSQLLAMEKKQVQQLQIAHEQLAEQGSKRSWWPFG